MKITDFMKFNILIILISISIISCSHENETYKKIRQIDKKAAKGNESDLNGAVREYDEIIKNLTRAIQGKYRAHRNLAHALMMRGSWDMAISNYEKALKIKPVDFSSIFYLGVCYANKGKADVKMNKKALEYYRKALNIKPKDSEVLYAMAMVYYYNLKDKKTGIEYLQNAIKPGSANPKHYAALAKIYYDNGNFLNSVEQYKDAIKYAVSKNDQARYYRDLYFVYKKSDKTVDAYDAIEKSFDLNPYNKTTKRILGKK